MQGIHNAMKSGMLAADEAIKTLKESDAPTFSMAGYQDGFKNSWIYEDLHKVKGMDSRGNPLQRIESHRYVT